MRTDKFFVAVVATLLSATIVAQEPATPVAEKIVVPMENEATNAEDIGTELSIPALDSLLYAWSRQHRQVMTEQLLNPLVAIDTVDLPASSIPDSVYIARLEAIGSFIPMAYNDVVRRYIISYTTRNKAVISRALGRSQYYFPIFEAELDAQNMPLELRMLPVIESALIPTARSPKGASGLWQFMLGTIL